MLWAALLALPIAAVAIIAFIYLYPFYQNLKVYNIKTGKHPKVFHMFGMIYRSIFYTRQENDKFAKDNFFPEKLYAKTLLHKVQYFTTDHKVGKILQSDQKTYIKNTQKISGALGRFVGATGVALVNGEQWKRQRKAMNPAFYDLEIFSPTFTEKAEKTVSKMWSSSRDGVVSDFTGLMQKMTLDILGVTIFDHEFNSLDAVVETNELKAYNHIFDRMFSPLFLLASLTLGSFSFLPFNVGMNKNIDVLDELVKLLVEKSKNRLESNKVNFSLLDYMVDAHLNGDESSQLSETEVRDNIIVFFIAGHETTASSLSYLIFLLGKYQKIQDKLREEIQTSLKGEKPSYKNVQNLEYLNCVIKEGMRVFNPLETVPVKEVTTDVTLGDYFLPKGSRIGIDINAIHHDKEVYGDPENFRPERWTTEEQEKRKIPSSAWLPFSSGSRICIGNNFSLIEQKIFLCELFQQCRITLVNNDEIIERDPKKFILNGPRNIEIKLNKL